MLTYPHHCAQHACVGAWGARWGCQDEDSHILVSTLMLYDRGRGNAPVCFMKLQTKTETDIPPATDHKIMHASMALHSVLA